MRDALGYEMDAMRPCHHHAACIWVAQSMNPQGSCHVTNQVLELNFEGQCSAHATCVIETCLNACFGTESAVAALLYSEYQNE